MSMNHKSLNDESFFIDNSIAISFRTEISLVKSFCKVHHKIFVVNFAKFG